MALSVAMPSVLDSGCCSSWPNWHCAHHDAAVPAYHGLSLFAQLKNASAQCAAFKAKDFRLSAVSTTQPWREFGDLAQKLLRAWEVEFRARLRLWRAFGGLRNRYQLAPRPCHNRLTPAAAHLPLPGRPVQKPPRNGAVAAGRHGVQLRRV